jgi:HEAT repeat protein/beta-lactamase regulating signal transducer with metallopeptidase domain
MNSGNPAFLSLALEVIVKSILLLGAALTLTWFMRRSSAALRHLLLSAAALSLLVLPLASLAMPSWNIVPVPSLLVPAYDNASIVPAEASAPEGTPKGGAAVGGSSPGLPETGSPTGTGALKVHWLTWLLIVWGAGGSILLLRLLGGKVYGCWIAGRAPAVDDRRLLDMVRVVSGRFGITRRIQVVESDHLKVPFVCGLLRSRLIIPPGAKEWSSERMEAVLLHELAHIKRMDILVQFFAQIACCMYWMNPLTWIMERRLFIERERACDDMVITRDIKASNYAGHLMEVMEEMGSTRSQAWVVSAIAEGTDFKDRIISVLDPVARRTAPKRSHLAAVIAVFALLVLPLSALHPSSRAATISEEAPGRSVTVGGPAEAGDNHSEEGDSRERREKEKREGRERGEEGDRREGREKEKREGRERGKEGDSRERREKESGSRQSDVLIALLENPDADVREHAAEALGRSGSLRAVPALIKALDDGDRSVREHVATALGQIGDTQAAPPLIRILRSDPDTGVREHAASALGMLGDDDDSYRTLVDVYDSDRNISVRAHAAFGLGLMRTPRAFDLLVDGLLSGHPEIRVHCAEALGLLGDLRALPHLEEALGDGDSRVRESARRALSMLPQER